MLQPNQLLFLSDAANRDLGQVAVERVDGDLVLGQFVPGPDFSAVEPLFAEYVEAANEQLLSVVGELDAGIRQLGLHLRCQDAANPPAIHDVQIGLGRINFRLCLEKPARTAMTPAVEIQTAPASR